MWFFSDNQDEGRNFSVTLPTTVTEGMVMNIGGNLRGGEARAAHYSRRATGDGENPYIERTFRGFTEGKVYIEKVEGRTYTIRLENVRMVATSIDGSDATGSFLVNGTFTATDTR
ncbi:MAG: hypothetical protein EOO38_32505 [Cytophagaceae bacterium]|nr:MAG: hypothetical protein EOO38_32505 [Cytophagaceae bacterium]